MAKTTKRGKSASTKSVKRSRTSTTRAKAKPRRSPGRKRSPQPKSKSKPAPKPRRTRVPVPSSAVLATDRIFAWEDDPGAPAVGTPIERPIPVAPTHGLATALRITGTVPGVGQHLLGSAEFRYWTAVEALERAAAFWASVLPGGTRWFTGASLPVALDAGLDLNAYYDRSELAFFHESVGGITVYSGESPDIVAHELGHAVLDAIRPQLWDAAAAEPAAFHEAFGDISAIFTALQLESLRKAVLLETEGKLYRNSRLSRVAEQLGWAIRQRHPDAVDGDSLRNAVNSFFYRDPQTLPPRAPASMLSSEPHSFARVFVGAFFEALAGMVPAPATSDGLLATATDAALLLVDAIFAAPVVPDYFSQIAAHMLESDHARFQGKYLEPLEGRVRASRRVVAGSDAQHEHRDCDDAGEESGGEPGSGALRRHRRGHVDRRPPLRPRQPHAGRPGPNRPETFRSRRRRPDRRLGGRSQPGKRRHRVPRRPLPPGPRHAHRPHRPRRRRRRPPLQPQDSQTDRHRPGTQTVPPVLRLRPDLRLVA